MFKTGLLRWLRTVLAVLAILQLLSERGYAMSCYRPENAVKEYSVVFEGKVKSTKILPEDDETKKEIDEFLGRGWTEQTAARWFGKPVVTTFRVIKSYKGRLDEEVKIFHRSNSVVGVSYEDGKHYIIYTQKEDEDRFLTSNCSTIIPFEKSSEGSRPAMSQNLLDLEVFKTKAAMFKRLVSEYPSNEMVYLRQGELYESYNDYSSAEQTYKAGLIEKYRKWLADNNRGEIGETEISASWWKEAKETGFLDNAAGRRFFLGYGRSLYMQNKYEQALIPLKIVIGIWDEAKKMHDIALIKLGRFDEIKELNLSGMEVSDLDLSNEVFGGANFSNTKIKRLVLHNTNLDNSTFADADIRKISIKDASLEKADFRGAKIGGSIDGGRFLNADFSNARMYMDFVEGSDFTGANFSNVTFTIYQDMSQYDGSTIWPDGFDVKKDRSQMEVVVQE